MLHKLRVGLDNGGCQWVDYALQVPGHWTYAPPPTTAAAAAPRLPVSEYYSQHSARAGGTWRYRSPADGAKLARFRELHPMPATRSAAARRARRSDRTPSRPYGRRPGMPTARPCVPTVRARRVHAWSGW